MNLLFKKDILKIGGILLILGLAWYGINYVQKVFQKAKQYDAINAENATLRHEKKTLTDSLKLHKEWLSKALYETKNATELYILTKGMSVSFQSVIKQMRDSVIAINKDRAAIDAKLLECQKDLERAKKKRKFL